MQKERTSKFTPSPYPYHGRSPFPFWRLSVPTSRL